MASRIGLRLMPNFRASSASLMRPPGLRRPDVISFSRKLRTCSDRLSVSKNEMARSHAEILGRPKLALSAMIADCGQKITQVKRSAIEKRRPPRSRISAKCAAPAIARRSSRSLDCIIFPVSTRDPTEQTSCHSNHQSRIWPRYQAAHGAGEPFRIRGSMRRAVNCRRSCLQSNGGRLRMTRHARRKRRSTPRVRATPLTRPSVPVCRLAS